MFFILRYSLSWRSRLSHSVHAGGCFLCTAWRFGRSVHAGVPFLCTAGCFVPFGARWGALFVHGEAFRPFRCTLRGRFCARRGDATASMHAGGAFAGEIKKCDIYNLDHVII